MSRAKTVFRQADIRRAVASAQAAGFAVNSIVIAPDGTITVSSSSANERTPEDAWAKWDAEKLKKK